MKTCSLLLVAAAAIVCAVVTPTTAIPGGWGPIPYIDSPHIQELGRWAVAEHVKGANDGLRFSKVVSGEQQDVAGMNYRLVIDALRLDGKDAMYKAEVYEDLNNARKLLSFGPAN